MRGNTGGDPLKKVKYGDKFNPSAAAWNTFIDAAQWVQTNKNQTGGSSPGIQLPIGHVLIKPDADIERFQPVKIGPPIFDPNSGTSNLFDYWKNNDPLFTAGNVTAADENSYGIAQQPIKSGSIGVAAVRGQTRAKVNVYSTTFNQWATIKPSSDYQKLFALDYGTSRILQIESGTGDKWALIDLHSERMQVVGGVLLSNLAPGGTASIGLYKDGATASSDTATIIDQWGIVTSTIASGAVVYGLYDPAIQKVIFEGPQSGLKIFCGKTNATFDALGTCSCSVWTPDSSGGLDSDSGVDHEVVDIGGITTPLDSGTVVYWSQIDGIYVLLGFIGGASGVPWGCVLAKNSLGSTISAFTCVAIPDLEVALDPLDPDGMALFKDNRRVWNIAAYTEAQKNWLGVTQEPIEDGDIGLVRVLGLTPGIITIGDATDVWCTPNVGIPTTFDSGFTGTCRIKWKPAGTGPKWGIIDIGPMRRTVPWGCVYGKSTDTPFSKDDLVSLPGLLAENDETGVKIFAMSGYDPAQENKFGYLLEDTEANQLGLVRILGPQLCRVNVTDVSHKYAIPGSTGTLKSGNFGPCLMLSAPLGTGEGSVPLFIHSDRELLVFGNLTDKLEKGGETNAIYRLGCDGEGGETFVVADLGCMLSDDGLESGTRIQAIYICEIQKAIITGYVCSG